MGYSISVRVKSQKMKKELDAFLSENYVPFTKVVPGLQDGDYSCHQELPSYAPRDFPIVGFDFNCNGPERDYLFAIVRTMAILLGNKKSIQEDRDLIEHPDFKYHNSKTQLYYYLYDTETMFIYLPKDEPLLPDKLKSVIVDEFNRNSPGPSFFSPQEIKKINTQVNLAIAEFRDKLQRFLLKK